MTEAKKKKDVIQAEVESFQYEMEKVREQADGWFSNEYTTANELLYSMFSDLYRLYETCVDTENASNQRKRDWLLKECQKRGIGFKKAKPTTQQLLVKYAFSVEGQNCDKRMSTYSRVLTIATATQGVDASNIADWIRGEGGIEEIRKATAVKRVSQIDKVSEIKNDFESRHTLGTVTTDKTKSHATMGGVVVAVGYLEKSGEVSVKEVIFEQTSYAVGKNISGDAPINAALSFIYDFEKKKEALVSDAKDKVAKAKEKVKAEVAILEQAASESSSHEVVAEKQAA